MDIRNYPPTTTYEYKETPNNMRKLTITRVDNNPAQITPIMLVSRDMVVYSHLDLKWRTLTLQGDTWRLIGMDNLGHAKVYIFREVKK